jgi:hypothetical protein
MLGGVALAVYFDWQRALLGLAFGVVAGGVGIVLVLFGALIVFAFLSRPRSGG